MVDFNNNRLVSIRLIPENKVRSQIMENRESAHVNTHVQITLPLNFLQITSRLNFLISALNTNAYMMVYADPPLEKGLALTLPTFYHDANNPTDENRHDPSCSLIDLKAPAGFYLLPLDKSTYLHLYWPDDLQEPIPNASGIVNGFFGACNPLDGLIPSTLDCLYNNICLQSLANYFVNLNQVSVIQESCFLDKIQFSLDKFHMD